MQARCVRSRLSATLSRHRTRSTWERPPRSSSHLGRGSVQSPEGGGTPHAASLRRWDSFGSWDSDMSLQDSVLMCAPPPLPLGASAHVFCSCARALITACST